MIEGNIKLTDSGVAKPGPTRTLAQTSTHLALATEIDDDHVINYHMIIINFWCQGQVIKSWYSGWSHDHHQFLLPGPGELMPWLVPSLAYLFVFITASQWHSYTGALALLSVSVVPPSVFQLITGGDVCISVCNSFSSDLQSIISLKRIQHPGLLVARVFCWSHLELSNGRLSYTLWHNDLHDFTAKVLSEVCTDEYTKPTLHQGRH